MAEPTPDLALQQRVLALEAELAASRAALQEFTYAVSHDLRAPLRHLVSFSQLLEEEAGAQLQGDSAEFVRTIRTSARHMGELLDALTGLSRIEALPVHMEPVALEPLLRECWAGVQATEPLGEVQLEWQVPEALTVSTDRHLLRQAAQELLGNALKFSALAQPARIQVTVSAEPGDDIVCRIADNGAGFNPAMHSKLFKVFGRLHTTRQFPGLGVGLLTARRLLAKTGARLTLDATPPSGAVAEIKFPRATKNPA
ncbi:ATP-binding protein [Rhodoferax sp.]|uniref:sensor histidine kinase n=1 Tax=Rhodoferax sp. TaxID=50421 RepID=UPI0025CEA476|nr:ATP-binding protein [Rhodoferax sp.]